VLRISDQANNKTIVVSLFFMVWSFFFGTDCKNVKHENHKCKTFSLYNVLSSNIEN
jgi:hypothetical protein